MNNRQDMEFEGILLVDKPQGITSHDVVDRLRRKLRMKKIGHAGTLDPLATGLLIMLIDFSYIKQDIPLHNQSHRYLDK